jgi:hypothetical protein
MAIFGILYFISCVLKNIVSLKRYCLGKYRRSYVSPVSCPTCSRGINKLSQHAYIVHGPDGKITLPPYLIYREGKQSWGTINRYVVFNCLTKNLCWNFLQSMGARNRVGIGLSYRPARQHSLAALVPWNRFLGSLTV